MNWEEFGELQREINSQTLGKNVGKGCLETLQNKYSRSNLSVELLPAYLVSVVAGE